MLTLLLLLFTQGVQEETQSWAPESIELIRLKTELREEMTRQRETHSETWHRLDTRLTAEETETKAAKENFDRASYWLIYLTGGSFISLLMALIGMWIELKKKMKLRVAAEFDSQFQEVRRLLNQASEEIKVLEGFEYLVLASETHDGVADELRRLGFKQVKSKPMDPGKEELPQEMAQWLRPDQFLILDSLPGEQVKQVIQTFPEAYCMVYTKGRIEGMPSSERVIVANFPTTLFSRIMEMGRYRLAKKRGTSG